MVTNQELRQARSLLEHIERSIDNCDGLPSRRHLLQLYGEVLAVVQECEKQSVRRHEVMLAHLELLDRRLLSIERSRPFRLWNAAATKVIQLYRRAGQTLLRSPLDGALNFSGRRAERRRNAYAQWIAQRESAWPSLETHRSVSENWAYTPLISIVIPVFESEEAWLDAALRSVLSQSYRPLEACIALDGEPPPAILQMLERWAARDPRVRLVRSPEGAGISAASNAAAKVAAGEYLGFLDRDDRLSPVALHYMVEALQVSRAGLLYCDQDRLDAAERRVEPVFKPDWSPNLLKSCMYVGRFLLVSRDLFQAVGGLRSEFDGAQDHDLVLRIAERPVEVHHVPKVLYHGRMNGNSTAGSCAAGRKAVEDALTRADEAAFVEPGLVPHRYHIRRRVPSNARLAIIVCSRTRRLVERCIRSVQATVHKVEYELIVVQHEYPGPDPGMRRALEQMRVRVMPFAGEFNFALMNNAAVRETDAPYLLFVNDDLYATGAGWCEAIVAELDRPEVGIAGAVLRYPSGAIQHAGVVLGLGDAVGHAGRFQFASDLWPWLTITREVSAVTGACLGMRKDTFNQLGGFDDAFPDNYNDVDLCLRAGREGLSVMCVSTPHLVHEGCATRAGVTHLRERNLFYERWAAKLSHPDPFYSPSLSFTEEIKLSPSNAKAIFAAK
jgi:GT2 family glycosyltransferase